MPVDSFFWWNRKKSIISHLDPSLPKNVANRRADEWQIFWNRKTFFWVSDKDPGVSPLLSVKASYSTNTLGHTSMRCITQVCTSLDSASITAGFRSLRKAGSWVKISILMVTSRITRVSCRDTNSRWWRLMKMEDLYSRETLRNTWIQVLHSTHQKGLRGTSIAPSRVFQMRFAGKNPRRGISILGLVNTVKLTLTERKNPRTKSILLIGDFSRWKKHLCLVLRATT